MLDEQDEGVPSGKITSSSLAVELAAGGVTPEHTEYVSHDTSKLNIIVNYIFALAHNLVLKGQALKS